MKLATIILNKSWLLEFFSTSNLSAFIFCLLNREIDCKKFDNKVKLACKNKYIDYLMVSSGELAMENVYRIDIACK